MFNEDGVISKAQEAKEKTEIAHLQERLELSKLSAYINEEYKFNLDDYFQSLEDEGIIGNKEDIVDNGDGTYEITTEDGYIFEVTVKPDKENPEEIEIEYVGKVDGPRIRKISATRVNDSTITVEVEVINAEGATYTYSYKKDGKENWIEASTENSSNTYTIEGLDKSAGYSIRVKVEKDGKSVEKEVTVAALEEIPGGDTALTDGTITVGEAQWSNGQASIEVSTNTGLQIQYQKNSTEGNWETPTDGKITGLKDGDKVNIRLTNGTRYGEPVTISIADEKAPIITEVSSSKTTNSVTLTVTAVDNESGLSEILNYKFEIKETSAEDSTYEEIQTGANATVTKSGLTQGTSYTIKVTLQDKAGNPGTYTKEIETETVGGASEGLVEGNIIASEPQWSNEQASIILSTNTGLQIQYQINSTEGSWSEALNSPVTVSNLSDRDTVYARLWDGTNAGDYSSVSITDNKAPSKARITLNTTSLLIGETLTATVIHIDNESGVDIVNSKWVMTESPAEIGTEEGSIAQYTESFTINGEPIELNSSTAGTYYLHVLTVDNAENKIETVSEAITIGAITGTVTQSGTTTWNEGQASIVLQSSDSKYQIVYKINGEGEWQEYNGTSIQGLSHGDTITACLTNEGQTTYGPEATFEIKDTTAPVITEESSNITTNSVTLTVTAVDNEAGLPETLNYKFEIKESSAEDSAYEKVQTGANATVTKSGLTQGTSYTIKVTLQDKAGNPGTYTKEIETETVGGASEGLVEGNIVASVPQWSDGTASITLSTSTELQIQYQKNNTTEGKWEIGTTGVQVTGLNHGDTVYARLYDGTNAGDYSSVSILDKTPPTITNIATSDITENSFRITVFASDEQSGLSTSNAYEFYIDDTKKTSGTTNSYTFSDLTIATKYTVKVIVKDEANNEAIKEIEISTDTGPSIVNSPEIVEGMTPVKYVSGTGWVRTTASDPEWYNYSTVDIDGGATAKSWANVVLNDATFNGNILNENNAYSMLVWIPRFAYKIESYYHTKCNSTTAGDIDIVFINKNNQDKNGKMYSTTYPSYTEGTTGKMEDYVVHPAFDYDGNQISGFWVGKYETSNTECNTTASSGEYNGTDRTIQIKAGVTSWRNISISNMYKICANMNAEPDNIYGLSTDDNIIDPHLMKNSEWGAVAYLSKSMFGKENEEVWGNPSSNYITGQAGTKATSENLATTNNYTTTNGQKASTNGNTTGIYDMSGGAWESVAACINNSLSTNLRSITVRKPEHIDVYTKGTTDNQTNNYYATKPIEGQGVPTNTTGHYGDAVYETSGKPISNTGGWYADYSDIPNNVAPYFIRGGYDQYGWGPGMFSFFYNGGSAAKNCGFRLVLTPNGNTNKFDILEQGAYVNYIDANGDTRKCMVLYDESSEYGIEIITMDAVEDINLGYNDKNVIGSDNFTKAMNSYNHVIKTLNDETQKYLNTIYADEARCVGSVPSEPIRDDADMFSSDYNYMTEYNGYFKDADINYESDWNQMETLCIEDINDIYWLASRTVTSNSSRTYFYVRHVNTSGGLNTSTLGSVYSSGDTYSYSNNYGLRPIFHLKSGIKVIGGTGDEDNPYILGTSNPVEPVFKITVQEGTQKDTLTVTVQNNKGIKKVELVTQEEIREYASGRLSVIESFDILENGDYTVKVTYSDGSIEEKSVTISNLTFDPIARIGSTEYDSLTEAVNAVQTGTKTTIEILKDFEQSLPVYIQSNKNIVIDLKGNTVKLTTGYISNSGTLEIASTTDANGELISHHTEKVCIANDGTTKITSGKISAPNTNAIRNNENAILTIAGGEISGQGKNLPTITNYANSTINITGGKVSSTNSTAIYNKESATMTMNSGTLESTNESAIKNQENSSINIIGGEVIGSNIADEDIIDSNNIYPVIWNDNGIVTIENAKVTGKNTVAVYNNIGTVNIVGGTYTTAGTSSNSITFLNNSSGTINLKKGKIISGFTAVANQGSGQIVVDGATITETNNSNPVIMNQSSGTIKIISGTLSSDSSNVIYNSSNGNIVVQGGELTGTGEAQPTIWNNTADGTITIGNGTIKAVQNETANVYNKGKLIVSGGNIEGDTSNAIRNDETGTATITNGTINARNAAAIHHNSTGQLLIQGGNITNTGDSMKPVVMNSTQGEVIVSNTIISTELGIGITNEGNGTITVNSGNITTQATNQPAIWNDVNGAIAILGGTISSNFSTVYNNGTGTITIGTDDGTVSTTNPDITSPNNYYTVYTDTLNYYDGILRGGGIKEQTVVTTPTGKQVVKNTSGEVHYTTLN